MRADVLRELSRPGSGADRLRARMTALAAAGAGVALLAAWSMAALRATEPTGAFDGSVEQLAVQGELAPFLEQQGLRPGAVLAAVLLAVPFLALALQALQVGSAALQRQAGLLVLAGATPGDLRRVRVRRTASAFAWGGLAAGPAYVLLWLLLGRTLPAGWRLLPTPQAWLPLAWLAVAGLLTLAGAVLGSRDRDQHADPLARARQPAPAPRALVAWLAGLGAVAVLLSAVRAAPSIDSDSALAAVLLVAALLLLVFVRTVVALRAARPSGAARVPVGSVVADGPAPASRAGTSRRSRSGPRGSRRLARTRGGRGVVVAALAAAQRRGSPRAYGAVAGVLFVCGLSFGVEAALVARVLDDPAPGESAPADAAFYVGGALLAAVVGVVGVLVALLALALSVVDHLLTARRSVASTAALGADSARLRAVQTRALSMTAVPATAVGTLLAGLLYGLGDAGWSVPRVLYTLAWVAAVAALAAVLVALACRLIVRALARPLKAAAALDNLRVP